MKELISIINELHAPKNKTNNFGKFNYRDAAGILEAVKPLLVKYNCLLIPATSEIKQIGDRYYLYCTVGIRNSEGKEIYATSPAREQDNKSGMDAAQLTGACISYAKKYALCSLFGIDDSSDDPDTDDSTKKQKDTQAPIIPQKPSYASPVAPKPAPQATAPTAAKEAPTEDFYDDGINLDMIEDLSLQLAIASIRSAKSVEELRSIWTVNKPYQSSPLFTRAKNARKLYLDPSKK